MAALKGLVIGMAVAIFIGAIVLIATVFGWGIPLGQTHPQPFPLVIAIPESTQVTPLSCDHKTCTFHVQSMAQPRGAAMNELWVFDHGSHRKIAIVQLKLQD